MKIEKVTKYKYLITYCILALITFIVYWPSQNYPFQFDDLPNILNYSKLKMASFSSLFFSQSRWLCTWINCLLYKYYNSAPSACRTLNILVHVFNGALLFWLILKN
jgi:hypothetical protein